MPALGSSRTDRCLGDMSRIDCGLLAAKSRARSRSQHSFPGPPNRVDDLLELVLRES